MNRVSKDLKGCVDPVVQNSIIVTAVNNVDRDCRNLATGGTIFQKECVAVLTSLYKNRVSVSCV